MAAITTTGTLTAGNSRAFALAPGSALTLTLLPNCRVTVTETPETVSASDAGGNSPRTHFLQYGGVFTYGPYAMGGSVVVANASNSGSTVTWRRKDTVVTTDSTGTALVSGDGVVAVAKFFPESYGTVGAGDDAVAVVAAAAAAALSGGALAFVPGKTYTFRNVPLPSGLREIDARGATIQYGGTYGTVAPLESVKVVAYADGSSESPSPSIDIYGGTWIGAQIPGDYRNVTSGTEQDALQFSYVNGVRIVGAIFKQFQQDAITFSNCPGSSVTYCQFEDICDGAVELRAGYGYNVHGNRFARVRHMVVNKPNINDVRVTGNSGSTFQQGIVIHGSDWVVEGNTIDVYDTPDAILGNSQPAIELSDYGGLVTPSDTYRTVIRGNTIRNRTNANGIQIKAPTSAYVPYDITIEANAIECRRGILLERGVNVTVGGNTIRGGAGGGITSNAANVAGLVINGNVIDAVGASGSGLIDVVTPDVTVIGNRVTTTTAGANGIRTTSAALRAALQSNTITVNSGSGILSNAAGSVITGNRVVTTAAAAIEVLGASTTVSANNLAPVGGEGVLMRAARIAVVGNTITSGTQGVRVGASGAGSSASNGLVSGNTITGCQFWGVNVTSGAVDTLIVGNNLVGNTSGAITDAGTTTTAANNKP